MERLAFLVVLALFSAATFAEINVEEDVTFRLFTKNNKYEWKNLGFDVENITSSGFDFDKDTKIITHGFLNNGSGMSCIALRDAFLEHQDLNVIIVDYDKIAADLLLMPEDKVKMTGEHVAKMVDFLILHGLDTSKIHLLGHSLGGHVVGYAATHAHNGKVARVSGLDPALMVNMDDDAVLNPDAAEYVDVIHTCQGVYGTTKSIGTVDFWPNGGRATQPTCDVLGGVTCSHYEAVRFMTRSINDPERYPARFCKSEDDFNDGICDGNEIAYMGIAAGRPAFGDYYINTEDEGDDIN
ncbi:inactive pancreatic lipase-related protein 1-like [Onthophagus taurus]|uniref:inactive pancreatic lipase-related protein 1-like n=1 Tax=Onthophagus taurus TaxID=166361 RepID=UPI000C2000AC|nr:inactive pancreatic lipase-related protein 1-like [Onthophagus taurus]